MNIETSGIHITDAELVKYLRERGAVLPDIGMSIAAKLIENLTAQIAALRSELAKRNR